MSISELEVRRCTDFRGNCVQTCANVKPTDSSWLRLLVPLNRVAPFEG